MFHQYFATRPRLSIIMPSGERISFVAHMFVTDKEHQIEFLDAEVKRGHPMIYTKNGEETVTAEQLDPLAAIKKKAIEEYKAQVEAQQNPERDMGNSKSETVLQTSKSIAAITVGSTGPAVKK